jgi:hypothetical protein
MGIDALSAHNFAFGKAAALSVPSNELRKVDSSRRLHVTHQQVHVALI